MNINYIILTTLIFFFGSAFASSDKKIDYLGIKDGLSMSAVTGIVQDKNGFIWFGTQEGLNRFDGYDFKIYRKDLKNKNSLRSNYISSMALDNQGNIWIYYNNNNFDRFNIETETFTHFSYKPEKENFIFKIYPDSKGNIWILLQRSGLCRFIPEENRFIKYFENKNGDEKPENIVTSIFEDKNGKIWTSSVDAGISIYNEQNDNFEKQHNIKNLNGNTGSIIVTENKIILSTFYNGFYILDRRTQTLKKVLLDKNKTKISTQPEIGFIQIDSKNNLWVGTFTEGIFVFDLEGNILTRYNTSEKKPISDNYVINFMEDNNGIIWLGTLGGGVNILKPKHKKIVNYKKEKFKVNSLSSKGIWGLYQDKNKILWAGTQNNGINKINRTTGKIIHLKSIFEDPETLSHDEVYCMTADSDGYLWVGTIEGLNRLDRNTHKVKRYYSTKKKGSLSGNFIIDLCMDKDNNLWIATENSGVNKLDSTRKSFKVYKNIPGNDESLVSNKISSIYADRDGFIWIGFWFEGLNRLDPKTGRVKKYFYKKEDKNSLHTHSVIVIREDNEGFLWIGSEDGLIKFDKTTEKFVSYTTEDGLPNNTVYGILEDNNGYLWISTNRGIARFDKKKEKFKIFDDSDGFQGMEYNTCSAFKTEDGELIFSGTEGISAFFPNDIVDVNYSTNPVITELIIGNEALFVDNELDDKTITKKEISYLDEINLPYYENNISIMYSSLDYFAPEKVRYSYIMENLDEKWVYADDRRFVAYNKMPPGNYIFRVKATNSKGLWTEKEKIVRINISPPIWQTSEFKILSVVLILLLIYAFYKMKMRSLKKQQEHLENLVVERTREVIQMTKTKEKFFSIIAHDLRSPFVSLLGFSEILHDEKGELSQKEQKDIIRELRKSVKSLYGLLNNLLNWSVLQTGVMSFKRKKFKVSSIIMQNFELFKSNAERKNIKILVDMPKDLSVYADENVTNTVLRNLISNAIKFTPNNGTIKICCKKRNDSIEFSVEDNGIGLTELEVIAIQGKKGYPSKPGTNNEKGTGIGLSLCKEMLDKIGGRFEVESKKGKGSNFKFYLPSAS